MAKRRLSKPITITLWPNILKRVDEQAQLRGENRSATIRFALFEWLDTQPNIEKIYYVNNKLYIRGKSLYYYLEPDMTDEQMRQTAQEYDRAQHQL